MPGHVEGDHAVARGDAGIVHQRPVLPPVGAGGVEAEQRRALAGLLDIDPVRPPEQIKMHVAAGDRLESGPHGNALARLADDVCCGRSLASASLK
jgi:hypothetical protein